MPKISIIIPVYNGEKYIRRCLDSVINQTYNDIQIIVINDGSIDNTENILKTYSDIVLINKENEGVSKARNTGLSLATGDYVYFCDADDYLEENAFEVLVKEYGENDLLRFGHYVVNGDQKKEKTNDDDVLAGVNVYAVDVETNSIKGTTTTNNDGFYALSNLLEGNYIVVFEYDTLKYLITSYQADNVDENKNFIGGLIAPGLKIQAKSLSQFTSKLPKLKIEAPENAIGKDTISAMLSGIVRGHAAMIDGMIKACEKELGQKATVIATGGYSNVLFDNMERGFDHINPNLTLEGLKYLHKLNCGENKNDSNNSKNTKTAALL